MLKVVFKLKVKKMLLTYFFYFLNVQMNILFDLYSDSGVCGLEKSEILFLIIKLCF